VQNRYRRNATEETYWKKLSIDERATLQSVVRIEIGWAWAGFM